MRRNQILLGTLLSCLAAAYLFAYFLPQTRRIGELKAQLHQARTQKKPVGEFISRLDQLQQRLDGYKKAMTKLDEQLPSTESADRFLLNVYTLMAEQKLRPIQVDPKPVEADGRLTEIPLTLSCEGSFQSVYQFLARLEGMPRISRLSEMSLAGPKDAGKGQVRLNLKLSVFSLESGANLQTRTEPAKETTG